MLDLGSQVSIIKSDLVSTLGLKRHYNNIPLVGIGGVQTNDGQHVSKVHFRPKQSDQLLSVTAVILKKPTTYLARRLGISHGNLNFSDNDTSRGSDIDIIFGCDILGKILSGSKDHKICWGDSSIASWGSSFSLG